jgi:RNA polymerase sigma factor (sigma-70 family)
MSSLTELVISSRKGDGGAYGEIVRRFQDMAVGYGYSRLRDIQLAEDAAQEAFLEAYLSLESLREPAAFPGWFRRIVLKQCDRISRSARSNIQSLTEVVEAPGLAASQQDQMETAEMNGRVWAAIDALPEHQRAAVILFYIGGHSQQEVSEFLDVPVTAVKKRLFSARNRLREMLLDTVADTIRESRPSRDEAFSERVLELLSAARNGDVPRVEALLRSDRRLLTARDWLGNTALIIAVNSGQPAVAGLLRKAGVNPDIHEAAAIGDTGRVDELLREDESRLESYSNEGFTPLALAAHYGHLETTRLLLEKGANPDRIAKHPIEVTALHAALFGRRVNTALLLISFGADVNAQRGGRDYPRSGWTALHYASSFGLDDLIQPLLAAGADKSITDDDGNTARDVALREGQTRIAEMLD